MRKYRMRCICTQTLRSRWLVLDEGLIFPQRGGVPRERVFVVVYRSGRKCISFGVLWLCRALLVWAGCFLCSLWVFLETVLCFFCGRHCVLGTFFLNMECGGFHGALGCVLGCRFLFWGWGSHLWVLWFCCSFGRFGRWTFWVPSLWVEAYDSDAFSCPVSWDYDSGAVWAWFGYFLDYFVALHLDFEWFLGGWCVFWHTNNHATLLQR